MSLEAIPPEILANYGFGAFALYLIVKMFKDLPNDIANKLTERLIALGIVKGSVTTTT